MTTPKLIYTFGLLWFFFLFLTGCGDEDTSFDEASISFTPQAKEVSSRASFINSTHDFDHFIVWGNYDGEKVFTTVSDAITYLGKDGGTVYVKGDISFASGTKVPLNF